MYNYIYILCICYNPRPNPDFVKNKWGTLRLIIDSLCVDFQFSQFLQAWLAQWLAPWRVPNMVDGEPIKNGDFSMKKMRSYIPVGMQRDREKSKKTSMVWNMICQWLGFRGSIAMHS